MKFSRSVFAKLATVAVALAAIGTATVAEARSNVFFSVGANVAPGVVIGATNAPVYYPPVYPQSYYVQPAPVYYAPTYYAPPPVYYGAPLFIGGSFGGHRHFHRGGFRSHGGHFRHGGHHR